MHRAKPATPIPNWPERVPIMREHGLPYDTPAPNVIVSGCQILAAMPQVLGILSRFLARRGLEHTFLSREYCCGNNLYRPAIKARDQEALAQCQALSRTYVRRNLDQATELGGQAADHLLFALLSHLQARRARGRKSSFIPRP